MSTSIGVDRDRFWRDGYLILRQLFTPDEFTEMRGRVLESLRRREVQGEPVVDALADPLVREYVYDERVLAVAKTLLDGQDVLYFGDASYAVVGHGYEKGVHVGGWHRDNTDRNKIAAPDWQGRYSLIRFGFYLQDHRSTSGGLLVRKRSHERIVRGKRAHLYDRYLNNGMGDVSVWSMRIEHAGLGRCLRGFPSFALGPALQNRLPEVLQAPFGPEERVGFWMSYGLDDAHLARHCEYLINRTERLEMWQHAHYDPAVVAACAQRGLKIIDMPGRIRAALAEGRPVGEHQHHYRMPF
jgi:hypothetical protein